MGSSTPSAPQPQTTAQSLKDWVTNYPQVFAMTQQYAPQEAALQQKLIEQYAAPTALALQQAQEQLYPETSAIQEELSQQAREGYSGEIPDWMRSKYLQEASSLLGSNITSPIGADYTSRGLLDQTQQYKQYYQNLGLTMTGRQPLTQSQSPSFTNFGQTFTPATALTAGNQYYQNQLAAYNANQQNSGNFGTMGALGGAGLGYALSPAMSYIAGPFAGMSAQLLGAGVGALAGGGLGSMFRR